MSLKDECLRLRKEQRLSYGEIIERTGVAKSSLSGWLRGIPLSDTEMESKIYRGGRVGKKNRGMESKYHSVVDMSKMSRLQKAKIAEAAVLFRLCVYGFNVYGSPFDGDRVDWVAERPNGSMVRIQVKWVKDCRGWGLPSISLRRCEGHNHSVRYGDGDFDFIVGYDFFSDTAYVYSAKELKSNKTSITVSPDMAERWDKVADIS